MIICFPHLWGRLFHLCETLLRLHRCTNSDLIMTCIDKFSSVLSLQFSAPSLFLISINIIKNLSFSGMLHTAWTIFWTHPWHQNDLLVFPMHFLRIGAWEIPYFVSFQPIPPENNNIHKSTMLSAPNKKKFLFQKHILAEPKVQRFILHQAGVTETITTLF